MNQNEVHVDPVIVESLAAEGWSQRRIAKHLGVGASTVQRTMVRYGIAPAGYQRGISPPRGRAADLPVEDLTRFAAAGLSQREIARLFGVAVGTVWSVCHRNGVTTSGRCRRRQFDVEMVAEIVRALGEMETKRATRES